MKQLVKRIKAKLHLWSLQRNINRPRYLPVGVTEFNEFCDDIILLAGEYADRDSMVYCIASNIVHIGHDKDAVPMGFFVRCLRKAAANQVASAEFTRIKSDHDKRVLEEQAKQQAEATAKSNAVANASPQKV